MRLFHLYCSVLVFLIGGMSHQASMPWAARLQRPASAEKAHPSGAVTFDVVSIKQIQKPKFSQNFGAQPQTTSDGYRSDEQTIWATIMLAYYRTSKSPLYWRRDMLSGGPPWLTKNQYVIDARVSQKDLDAWQKPDPDKDMLRNALQQMLKERCKLTLHRTMTEQPVYELRIKPRARLKFKEANPDEILPKDINLLPNDGGFKDLDGNAIRFYKISMDYVIAFLTAFGADRPVINMTGLRGKYDFILTPRQSDEGGAQSPGITWDLESIGLTLRPAKAPVETLVIDHVEEPSPN